MQPTPVPSPNRSNQPDGRTVARAPDVPAALAALARALGPDAVLTGAAESADFARDQRGLLTSAPAAVVLPATTAETALAVGLCVRYGVPVVPYGGGTGLVGGAVPLGQREQVVISVRRMNRILSVQPADYAITAQAGCTVQQVQQAAAQADRLFPLSLASEGSCQIGGVVATNAGGLNVLRYGMTRELVLGIEAVLPDGRIWDGLRSVRKDNTGYDLKQLFIGSEGTLGIVTAAALRLYSRPCHRATALLALPGLQALAPLLELAREHLDERLSALELISRTGLELVLRYVPGVRDPFAAAHPCYTLVEITSSQPDADLDAQLEAFLAAAVARGLVADAVPAFDRPQAAALWRLREGLSEAEQRAGGAIKHDVSVPLGAIAGFVLAAQDRLSRTHPGAVVNAFGHIGDGNVHFNVFPNAVPPNAVPPNAVPPGADPVARQGISEQIYQVVGEWNGSISAEHGIGVLKREALAATASPVEQALLRAVKQALDPAGLMNPGKLLAVEPRAARTGPL